MKAFIYYKINICYIKLLLKMKLYIRDVVIYKFERKYFTTQKQLAYC